MIYQNLYTGAEYTKYTGHKRSHDVESKNCQQQTDNAE